MFKDQYLKQLRREIKDLPELEQKEILADIGEIFQMGGAEGKSDEQIANNLGDPKTLARTLKADIFINDAQEQKTWRSFFKAFGLLLGMSLFNFMVMLTPFLFASVTVLSLMAIGLILITGSFFLLVKVPIVTAIFNGCIVLGAGMAVFMAGFDLSKLIFRVFLRYFKWNVSVVRRETIESKNVV
ncbi:DUF1700 domain-containing protein [Bacillus amyloliquefaciens]|uniref:HAAS signaling domain-containing protein n=1 Tax=Bacillus amyloliquefaciens TaxID=1390 RepID=UPI0025A09243|nr:DUF1700 domain-containing protein [Bacillus amyloliquefaciens]WJM61684.1 DUF1700 domain-containing protein [Bacillus amyloliquefaciens]